MSGLYVDTTLYVETMCVLMLQKTVQDASMVEGLQYQEDLGYEPQTKTQVVVDKMK